MQLENIENPVAGNVHQSEEMLQRTPVLGVADILYLFAGKALQYWPGHCYLTIHGMLGLTAHRNGSFLLIIQTSDLSAAILVGQWGFS